MFIVKVFRYFTIVALLVFGASVFGQSFTIVLLDKITKSPLQGVVVSVKTTNNSLLTDELGKVNLTLKKTNSIVDFYKLGYIKSSIIVGALRGIDTVYLSLKTFELQEVLISSEIKKTAYKNAGFNVSDYVVLNENTLLVAAYHNNKKDFGLICYKIGERIFQKTILKKDEFDALFTDCLGNLQLVTKTKVYQIVFNSDTSFFLLPPHRRGKFDSVLEPCKLRAGKELVFAQKTATFVVPGAFFDAKVKSQGIAYYKYENQKPTLIKAYGANKEKMEMLNSEADHTAANNAATGAPTASAEANSVLFYEQVLKEIYVPIFNSTDTLIVFNFDGKNIDFLSLSGKLIRQVSFQNISSLMFHSYSIIKDEATKKYYFQYKEKTSIVLSEFNINSGELKNKTVLEYPFPKLIKVHNGLVYYLEQGKNWDESSVIYYQTLN